MLDVLWRILATRDLPAAEHAVRVQRLCVAVAHEIGLDDELIVAVHAAVVQRVRAAAPGGIRDFPGFRCQLPSVRVM